MKMMLDIEIFKNCGSLIEFLQNSLPFRGLLYCKRFLFVSIFHISSLEYGKFSFNNEF